jgi:WD40 repeat protein
MATWKHSTSWTALRFSTLTFSHTNVSPLCRFSPDGKVICTADGDGSLRLWASMSGICIRSVGIYDTRYSQKRDTAELVGRPSLKPWDIIFSCDGSRVTCSYGAFSLEVWNLHSDVVSRMCDPHPTWKVEIRRARLRDVWSSCISPDGTCVFWSRWGDKDVDIRIVDSIRRGGGCRRSLLHVGCNTNSSVKTNSAHTYQLTT